MENCLNINIVECKDTSYVVGNWNTKSLNINIVECKESYIFSSWLLTCV